MSEMLHFRQRRGLFSRPEVPKFHNQPVKYWQLYGSETQAIQELAIILFSQVTSASACETNWSQFEFVYSKRKIELRTEKARKLVYVHSNLKQIGILDREH